MSTLSSTKLFILAANAVAHAAEPHAFVKPAPLSHTFTAILFLSIIMGAVVLASNYLVQFPITVWHVKFEYIIL